MTATVIPALHPKNDLGFVATLKTIDEDSSSATFGRAIPLTTGTVTAFLALSDLPTETAADPTLTTTATYLGSRGKWLIKFDASVLTASLLSSLFTSATPYVIVEQANGIRTVAELAYTPSRYADVTE